MRTIYRFSKILQLKSALKLCLYVASCNVSNTGATTNAVSSANSTVIDTPQLQGTDSVSHDDGSAWFLGDHEVRYCFVHNFHPGNISSWTAGSRTFHADAISFFKPIVHNVVENWQDFFKSKFNFEGRDSYVKEGIQIKTNEPFVNDNPKNWIALDECNGSEQLTIYLGTDSEETNAIKKLYFNPIAFAHKTHYDSETGQGKGFIWIKNVDFLKVLSNRENDPKTFYDGIVTFTKNKFYHIMTHELGHVFGFPHIENTLMSESFAHTLSDQGKVNRGQDLIHIPGRWDKGIETTRTYGSGKILNFEIFKKLFPERELRSSNLDVGKALKEYPSASLVLGDGDKEGESRMGFELDGCEHYNLNAPFSIDQKCTYWGTFKYSPARMFVKSQHQLLKRNYQGKTYYIPNFASQRNGTFTLDNDSGIMSFFGNQKPVKSYPIILYRNVDWLDLKMTIQINNEDLKLW